MNSLKLFLFTLLLTQNLFAQNKRPAVGLTLSGGGAKGLAHIGILQAIDSAGLKIDYITGTSMGSIMGGMYAAGYSGDSIEKIARAIDWELVFSTSPKLSNIGIEEKAEYDKYLFEVPYENGKFKIGKGFIEGQELWLKFSEVFQPVYNIHDFDKLSIPFRCIGTDLSTGNAVEMKKGNIVTALRASMAIPSVFTPVWYEDKLLVDGGVVENFPVLAAKKMGADYMIGVNVSGGLLHADSLESALDILLQIGFFKDADNFDRNKKACNIYITPDLKGNSTGSFDASDSIIELGKVAGRMYYPYFKKLADSLNAIYPTKFVKDRIPRDVKINIEKYSIEGLQNTTEQFFFGLLNLPANQDYSNKKMSEAIRRVNGSRYYKVVNYDFIPLPSGKTELHFRVQEHSLTAFKFALNYTNFTEIGLKLNLTGRDFIFKESRALASFELSQSPRAYGEYYHFLNRKRTARLHLNCYFESVDYPIYDNFRLYQTLRSGWISAEAALQVNLNVSSFIAIGQERVFSNIKTIETPSLIYNGNNNFWHSKIYYVVNNVNRKYFPTTGWNVRVEAGFVYDQDPDFEVSFSDKQASSDTLGFNYDDYPRLYISGTHYNPLNDKFSFSQNLTLAYLIADNPYIANDFVVGGINEIIRNQVPFAGLDESEIKSSSIATLQLGLQFKILRKSFLTGRFNAGLYDFHHVDLADLEKEENLLTGYGLTFGYDSPIGPIELTGMYCDQDGKVRSNIRLGYTF